MRRTVLKITTGLHIKNIGPQVQLQLGKNRLLMINYIVGIQVMELG